MNKKEIAEIKKQFTPDRCAITRICGCYVNSEKEKQLEMKEAFLSLSDEEMFKYFDIFRKTLSGTIGKNLLNMEFPLQQELEGGTQEFLLKLRDSGLKDEELVTQFYDRVISSYDFGENYLILLIHAAYDIPGKTNDGLDMDDASTDVYQYVLCSICPVKLSKAALCYNAQNNTIEERIRDWIVDMPSLGFLFPAFNDRNTDLHSLLYYSKNAEELHQTLINEILGCVTPLSAKSQKETFNSIIQETFGPDCDYEAVKTIHEKITEMVDEHADEPEPLTLDKYEVKKLLQEGGATKEDLEDFDERYDDSVGEKSSFLASNISSARKFEIKTPDVVIQVNPECTDLMETQVIDGRTYLMIEVTDSVEVNGLSVRPISHNRKKENASPLD